MLESLPDHILEKICLYLPTAIPFLLLSKTTYTLCNSPYVKSHQLATHIPKQILASPHLRHLLFSSEQTCIQYMRLLEPKLKQLLNDLKPFATLFERLIPFVPGRRKSTYNWFLIAEVPKVKAMNPGISHKEAFMTAARNVIILLQSF
ncbi:hypothetical protein HDV00_006113 [Rhizophlyctis rosea]|nr:hypothetical protein HDV00_006113 [Rhizophlyctis rosea]